MMQIRKKIQTITTPCYALAKTLAFSVLLFSFINTTKAQDFSVFNGILDNETLGKLNEAVSKKEEADKLMGEIALLNQEYFKLESDYELTQKQFEKKAGKIEKDIKSKRDEAFKTYESSNKTIYKLLTNSVESQEGGVDKEARLLAIDYAKKEFDKASDLRKESLNAQDEIIAVNTLTKASESEQKAIDKLAQTLAEMHGKSMPEIEPEIETEEFIAEATPEEPPASPVVPIENETVVYPSVEVTEPAIAETPENTGYAESTAVEPVEQMEIAESSEFNSDDMLINQEVVEEYSEYVEDDNIPDPLTINQIKEKEGEIEYDSLSTAVRNDYYEEEPQTTTETIGIVTEVTPEEIPEPESEPEPEPEPVAETVLVEEAPTDIAEVSIPEQTVPDSETITTEESSPIHIEESPKQNYIPEDMGSGNELEFRVQVAASKGLLTPHQLKHAYQGKAGVMVIQEDGWYKYQTIGFSNYNEALKFAQKIDVKGVFIIAYQNNEKVDLTNARTQIKNTRSMQSDEIEFAVQIAASRYSLNDSEIKAIYQGQHPIRLLMENGWYKYQLIAEHSYIKAVDLKQDSGVHDAFIVSYKRSEKMKLYQAVQTLKR